MADIASIHERPVGIGYLDETDWEHLLAICKEENLSAIIDVAQQIAKKYGRGNRISPERIEKIWNIIKQSSHDDSSFGILLAANVQQKICARKDGIPCLF